MLETLLHAREIPLNKILPDAPFYRAFEQDFRAYLTAKYGYPALRHGMPHFLTAVHETVNFNRYEEHLERACDAAVRLPSYDIVMGIAKKGMWLSYVLHKMGRTTSDAWLERHGDKRASVMLGPIDGRSVQGRKILLVDNDVLTGTSLNHTMNGLRKFSPARCDVLLIYNHAQIAAKDHEGIKSKLDKSKTLGQENGLVYLDCRAQLTADKIFTLAEDFKPNRKALRQLKRTYSI